MLFVYNDGGREAAGYKGNRAGDCVCRAICIAGNLDYETIYQRLAEGNANQRVTRRSHSRYAGVKTARQGIFVRRKWFKDMMADLGFNWTPTMGIGTGCKVHLEDGELPMGRLVVALSRHYTTVINGVIHDTYNPTREKSWMIETQGGIQTQTLIGGRCVYGYWSNLDELE